MSYFTSSAGCAALDPMLDAIRWVLTLLAPEPFRLFPLLWLPSEPFLLLGGRTSSAVTLRYPRDRLEY